MTPWPCGGLRRASINSFGYGGSNAHAILDDAFNYLQLRVLHARHCTVASPPEITVQTTNHPDSLNNDSLDSKALQSFSKRLFVWSAADKNAASRIAATYGPYFRSLKDKAPNEDQLLNDLAYTLAERRGRFNWRTFAVASSITELANIVETDLPPQVRAGQSVKLGFVFTGQGAQWAGMGRELLLSSSAYQESIQAADKFFKSLGSSWSLIEELEKDQEHSRIDEPMISQPACTAIQTALVDLLAGWGVVPLRVVGHSSGEIAAAYCIGALDRESAWKAAYFRGLVSQKLRDSNTSRGGMMAAGIAEGEANHRIQKFDNGHLTVACINSPSNVTISGDASAVEALHRQLESEGVFARRLNVCIAYHSSHMRVVASDYASMLGNLRGSDSQTTGSAMFSSVTSKEVSPKALQLADYWVQNLISPVKFSEALVTLCTADLVSDAVSRNRLKVLHDQTKIDSIVEIGPHSALRSAIRQTLSVDSKFQSINYFSALTRDQSSVDSTLQLAGSLFARGHNITLDKINNQFQDAQSAAPTMLTGLPPYPWNRSDKFWFESRLSKDYRFRKHPRHDLLGAPVSDWNPSEPRWRHFLRISENPWIKDHKVTKGTPS
jgi:acyl transferase domain-containing protein